MNVEDLRDTVEGLREIEDLRERTTKVRIAVIILLITILGTVAAVLASLADAHAVTTERQQEVHALAGQQSQDAAAANQISYTENLNQAQLYFDRDAAWWAESATSYPQMVHVMRTTWLRRSHAWEKPFLAAYNRYLDTYAASKRQGEQALVDGQAVAAWREKEDGYITSAAVFAVSLFLVGLVLTARQRSGRRIFVTASILLALFASFFVAQTYSRRVPSIEPRTLKAYTDGERALQQGYYRLAAKSFRRAVTERPLMPEAWFGLAQASGGGGLPSRSDLTQAVAAYHHVIAEGEGSLLVRNNLAFDELLLGQLGKARHDIALALKTRNDVDWSYAEGTLAEINMMSGNLTAAYKDLDSAVRRVALRDIDYRETFFSSLRDDRAYFSATGVAAARWKDFYARVVSIEASLDAIGEPAPGPRGHAAVYYVTAKYYDLDPLYGQGLVGLSFAYSGFTKPGVFSFRTYSDDNGQYQLLEGSSVTRADKWSFGNGTGSFTWYVPLMVSPGYRYQIELYWNGNLLASTPVNVPAS